MKSNFVSMASHEFRTPLSTVLSSISLIENYKTAETQDKRDKHVRRIKSAVTEMVATLEEFLSLEKIDEGKVHLKKEVFNLKELAEQAIVKFHTVLKAKQEIAYKHSGKDREDAGRLSSNRREKGIHKKGAARCGCESGRNRQVVERGF